MALGDPPFNYAYRKRHFFDVNQEKLEKSINKPDIKNNMLVRTSLTPNERILQGIKKELLSYKKMLLEEQNINAQLRSEIHHLSNKNNIFKTQLLEVQRVMDKPLYTIKLEL